MISQRLGGSPGACSAIMVTLYQIQTPTFLADLEFARPTNAIHSALEQHWFFLAQRYLQKSLGALRQPSQQGHALESGLEPNVDPDLRQLRRAGPELRGPLPESLHCGNLAGRALVHG